ncbi:MAG: hypothetical protein AMXMBFR13_34650 [Phycisphaerae bacterium]
MPLTTINALTTIGRIASRLNAPLHKIRYIIQSRDIRPIAKVGALRVWDESAVQRIAHELNAIAEGQQHDA